jgi:hypothetical protein
VSVPPSATRAEESLNGPFVSVTLWENVIEERDGTLTAIRLIDQLNIDVPPSVGPDVETVLVPKSLAILVTIRDGEPNRAYEINIRLRSPDGRTLTFEPAGRVIAGGSVNGANFIARTSFGSQLEGLYHFDIALGGDFMTSVPLRVAYGPKPERAPSGS